jgi:hypothetical protein
MKKYASLLILLVLLGSVSVLTANARMDDPYAVGGEILPLSLTSTLFSPWLLALISLIMLAVGGAFYTGKITIKQ